MKRRIAAVTVARSDYGCLLPVLQMLHHSEAFELQIIVTGAHLGDRGYGCMEAIRAEGFQIAAEVPMMLQTDAPEAVAISHGLGTMGLASAYARLQPDLILLLGDRMETHAAACAAVPLRIPIAHLHGGEVTAGAIDDVYRHAITKLSHLHFASAEEYAQRIRQMGEESWRVQNVGAPALGNVAAVTTMDRANFLGGLRLGDGPFLLATYHPVTLEPDFGVQECRQLLDALRGQSANVLFTGANHDSGGAAIRESIENAVAESSGKWIFAANLGIERYLSAMAHADRLVAISPESAVDIDSELDLAWAEFLLSRKG